MNFFKIAFLLSLTIYLSCDSKPTETTENEALTSENTVKEITDPNEYDSKITAELIAVNQELFSLLERISASDSIGIIKQFNRATWRMSRGIDIVEKLPAFEGDNTYKNSALAVLKFHRTAMDTQYKRIVEISAKKKATTEEEEERESLYEKMENKEEYLDDAFFKQREAFGTKHNVRLIPAGELQL